MTLHDTRTANTSRTSKGSSITSSSEQNDIKKLKSKYSAKLPTLKVLFADWSDEDLLFVLEEANGDLDLTIDRISEGHASQWGEVKTKKSKKEAQKAKAVTTGVSTHNQQSTTTPPPATSYRDTRPSQTRSFNDRPSRPGKASSSTSRSRPSKSTTVQSASWDTQPKQSQPNNDISAGSWASIASLKQANDNANDGWSTTATNNDSSMADEWGAPVSSTTNAGNNSALSPSTDETGEDQPKTWASLLKSKPKPEPEPTTTTSATTTDNAFSETNTAANNTLSEWDVPNTSNLNDKWNTDTTNATKEVDEWSTPVHESAPVEPAPSTNATIMPTHEESSWNSEEQKQPEVDGWGNPLTASEEKPAATASAVPETTTTATSGSRLLNQEEPVKLPENTSSAMSSLDVKFGSLNVDEEPKKTEELTKENTTAFTNATSAQDESTAADSLVSANTTSASSTSVPANSAPSTETAAPAPIPATHDTFGQTSSAYLKQQEPTATTSAYSQHQQQPAAPINNAPLQQQQQQQTTHQLGQQPQQQQIPQQLGMDHLTSAYSSYLPNQPPTGLSGFGMNPMGSLPDYGLYSTEAQRAAAMGYYDPTAFSHSPSVTSASAYGSRDKYNQDGLHNQNAQAQNMPQQQMYPTNLPYYQYYYMPNQFNAYQSAYGQPFMNKSMYPSNMYQQQQQQPGKPSTATSGAAGAAASPYAAAGATGTTSVASPYGQQQSQLYNHQYDDLQQLGMGLNDYQKSSMYGNTGATTQPHQQLQGFLGNLNNNATGMGGSGANAGAAGAAGAAGQTQSQQTPSQGGAGVAGQTGQKSVTGGNASTSTPHQQHQSNPQQHHHQQHQPAQQQPYGSNYFGQPMFSYGQYPQQFQQQMPPQHQQQQSQQPSRQQQYWAQ